MVDELQTETMHHWTAVQRIRRMAVPAAGETGRSAKTYF